MSWMRRAAPSLLAIWLLIPVPAPAQDAIDVHASYDLYAAGFHVRRYGCRARHRPARLRRPARLPHHRLVSLFHHGHQLNTVFGTWQADRPQPEQFQSVGVWEGEDKVTLMDYLHGQPLVRKTDPAAGPGTRAGAVVVAAELGGFAQRAGLHDPPGDRYRTLRRLAPPVRRQPRQRDHAHTAGEENLLPNSRSIYSGKALRCDFVGQMLAGFQYQDNTAYDHRPLHGSAWLAAVVPGAPPVPVQMQFDTRWFGEATMYLTQVGENPRPWSPRTEPCLALSPCLAPFAGVW